MEDVSFYKELLLIATSLKGVPSVLTLTRRVLSPPTAKALNDLMTKFRDA
jgi:hypothetical protein